jgi:hypothetical protein
MSPVMKRKLRRPVADVDMICSQPSCPICSEDFAVGNEVLQLPCTHIYHETCVVPWLDMKKTCPICRYLLTNEIPSVTDLEKFPRDELARLLATEKKEYAEEERARAKKRAMSDDADDTAAAAAAAVPLKEDEEEEDKEGEGEGGGREFVNKTKLAHDIVETMNKRRAAQDKDIGIMNSDRTRSLRERQQQPQREEGYRTARERVQNPSPSNRTLREVIEEAERERERQNSDRRDRMRALGILPTAESIGTALGGGGAGSLPAMRSPALAAPDAVGGMRGGGGQQDDFSRMLSAILHSSNMGLQGLSDSDHEGEGEGEEGSDVRMEREIQRRAGGATGTPGSSSGIVDDRAVSEAQASLLHARTALASAREENTRLEGMPYGSSPAAGTHRTGAGLMPTTFVIRSNGSDSMQIERRQALREAIDAID